MVLKASRRLGLRYPNIFLTEAVFQREKVCDETYGSEMGVGIGIGIHIGLNHGLRWGFCMFKNGLSRPPNGLKSTHLVRGLDSDVVSQTDVDYFKSLVPHAQVSVIASARHMVAGDSNHVFGETVSQFLSVI